MAEEIGFDVTPLQPNNESRLKAAFNLIAWLADDATINAGFDLLR